MYIQSSHSSVIYLETLQREVSKRLFLTSWYVYSTSDSHRTVRLQADVRGDYEETESEDSQTYWAVVCASKYKKCCSTNELILNVECRPRNLTAGRVLVIGPLARRGMIAGGKFLLSTSRDDL
jgi:hypothetical protein